MKGKKRTTLYLTILTFVIIGLLVTLLYRLQVRSNREKAFESSSLLIDQIKTVIETNNEKLISLMGSLSDDYVTRSKALAYIIDKDPSVEKHFTEMSWLTTLLSVDEINLFDPDGNLYAGTKSQYIGENLKTSKRFGIFAKMLNEYNFTMCKSVSDDGDEDSQMMYAISWSDDHKRLAMVGITPRRLMNEIAVNQMDAVISDFPAYEGIEILVADDEDNIIIGATNTDYIGRNLTETDLSLSGDEQKDRIYTQTAVISDEECYCSLERYNKYKIIVARYRSVINRSIVLPLLMIIVYMLLAALTIVLIVKRMTRRIIREHENANSDAMTGLLNRRAYETDIRRYDGREYEPTLVYVSMDLNGLKQVNDSLGHEAGDSLICGAADCMKRCFGNYGELYRVGGDEFAALIFADEDRLKMIQIDFSESTQIWGTEHDLPLTVSCGYIRVCEHADLSFNDIAALADEQMYRVKDEFYRKKNLPRR